METDRQGIPLVCALAPLDGKTVTMKGAALLIAPPSAFLLFATKAAGPWCRAISSALHRSMAPPLDCSANPHAADEPVRPIKAETSGTLLTLDDTGRDHGNKLSRASPSRPKADLPVRELNVSA